MTRRPAEHRPSSESGGKDTACWLCSRPLGDRVECRHPVPKGCGGRAVARGPSPGRPTRLLVAVHPICHRTLHARFSNAELQRIGDDPATLRGDPEIARFLAWIGNKPPDFHAPTRRKG